MRALERSLACSVSAAYVILPCVHGPYDVPCGHMIVPYSIQTLLINAISHEVPTNMYRLQITHVVSTYLIAIDGLASIRTVSISGFLPWYNIFIPYIYSERCMLA